MLKKSVFFCLLALGSSTYSESAALPAGIVAAFAPAWFGVPANLTAAVTGAAVAAGGVAALAAIPGILAPGVNPGTAMATLAAVMAGNFVIIGAMFVGGGGVVTVNIQPGGGLQPATLAFGMIGGGAPQLLLIA